MLIANGWITLAPTQKCLINFWISFVMVFSCDDFLLVRNPEYQEITGEGVERFTETSASLQHWCLPDPRNYVSKSLECPILCHPTLLHHESLPEPSSCLACVIRWAHVKHFQEMGPFLPSPTSICYFTTSAIETVLLFGKDKSLIVQQGAFVNNLGVAHIFI